MTNKKPNTLNDADLDDAQGGFVLTPQDPNMLANPLPGTPTLEGLGDQLHGSGADDVVKYDD